MRFWDASALVPLLFEEATSVQTATWLEQDPHITLWGLTRVELTSAVERRAREGVLTPSQRRAALRRLTRVCDSANEVTDLFAVRSLAATLLGRHSLRSADALQLAAALLVAQANPTSPLVMVVLDRRLAGAADREGLELLS